MLTVSSLVVLQLKGTLQEVYSVFDQVDFTSYNFILLRKLVFVRNDGAKKKRKSAVSVLVV